MHTYFMIAVSIDKEGDVPDDDFSSTNKSMMI